VESALKKHSARITARDSTSSTTSEETTGAAKGQTLTLDPKGFLGS
jgi:hypothetical protein